MIKIGIYGLGTVGRGLVQILQEGNFPVEIAAIADRSYQKKKEWIGNIPASDNPAIILDNPEIDIAVELIGGVDSALFFVREALMKGKRVVTANKALLAEHGFALFSVAKTHGTQIAFEAAVAGAVPIIRNLLSTWTSENIFGVYGILNGTSNYILTRMRREKKSYQEILAEAQKLGLAEADPSFDVRGTDAMHKIALISSIVTGKWSEPALIETRGIDNLKLTDVIWAEKMGYRIRLIARLQKDKNQVFQSVEPTLIDASHPLFDIDFENNGILIEGLYSGSNLLAGKGAGSLPTGFSVLGDILLFEKNHTLYKSLYEKEWEYLHTAPVSELSSEFYLRLHVEDKPMVLAKIAGELGENGISIASAHQEITEGDVILVIITHTAKNSAMRKAFTGLTGKEFVSGESVFLPIAPHTFHS